LGDTVTVLGNHERKKSKSDPLDSIVETPTRSNCLTGFTAVQWIIWKTVFAVAWLHCIQTRRRMRLLDGILDSAHKGSLTGELVRSTMESPSCSAIGRRSG
jgi:hypothetical protein